MDNKTFTRQLVRCCRKQLWLTHLGVLTILAYRKSNDILRSHFYPIFISVGSNLR